VRQQSIPLVPFNAEQNKILVYQPFVLLLHKLGFHLPADANKLFVRIPEFWTSDIMFSIAEKLGPISKGEKMELFSCLSSADKTFSLPANLKFDVNRVRNPKSDLIDSLCADSAFNSTSEVVFALNQRSQSSKPIIRLQFDFLSPQQFPMRTEEITRRKSLYLTPNRFTPEVTAVGQSWLQVVMQSKASTGER
jgi:Timeless PAB domain